MTLLAHGASDRVDASAPVMRMRRIGVLMEPLPGTPREALGVFNPGAARGPDGALYLFPRLMGADNVSRIGIARVGFDAAGEPATTQRLGIALEPGDDDIDRAIAGCEDARVSWVEPLGQYVMTYTALTPSGPRIAIAISRDALRWEKLGLAWFETQHGPNLNDVRNKDGVVFPVALKDPRGVPSVAMIHRPYFPGSEPQSILRLPLPRVVDVTHESMWISYCPIEAVTCNRNLLCHFMSHHRLASPLADWERVKIGAGTPPLPCRYGFVMVYHGVAPLNGDVDFEYCAGLIVLDARDGKTILFRAAEPILRPETPEERTGTVPHVVFPTGIDRRTDIGLPDRYDIYYGMADSRVGVASLDVPAGLSLSALRDRSNPLGANGSRGTERRTP